MPVDFSSLIKNQNQSIKIDLNNCPSMKCMNILDNNEICNGEIFVDAFKLKYISPLQSPTGKQTIGTISIGKMCAICGKIFNPEEWMKGVTKNATTKM